MFKIYDEPESPNGGGACVRYVLNRNRQSRLYLIYVYIYVYIIYIYTYIYIICIYIYMYIYILLNRNRQRRGRVHGFEPENAKRGGVFKIYVEEKAPNEGSC